MAPPSAQTLQRVAGETGYQPGTLEKAIRLLEALVEINRDPFLAGRLVLKGGTALNVFHLDLDRLSIDIDLNYIGALDRTVMESERPEIDAAIDRLLVSQGYSVRRRPEEHAGGKWLSRYTSALGGNVTLLKTDPETRTRINAMPMLAWKAMRVRRHQARSRPILAEDILLTDSDEAPPEDERIKP